MSTERNPRKTRKRPMKKRTGHRGDSPRHWPLAPHYDEPAQFVFMSVDVIGHSRLFARCSTFDEKLMIDDALTALMQHIRECIPSYQERFLWDWAGDGGLYAFPISVGASYLGIGDVNDAARAILARLDAFNATHIIRYDDGDVEPIRLRVVLTIGEAVYRKLPHLRRGTALNMVGKIKLVSNANSLAITDDVYKQLRAEAKQSFVLLPPWWAPASSSTPVTTVLYGDVDRLRTSLLSRVTEHIERHEPLFAAHYRFRLAAIALAHLDLDTAAEELQQAEELAAKGASTSSYHRTLAAFYRTWHAMLQRETIRQVIQGSSAPPYARLALLLSPKIKTACDREGLKDELRMLIDLEGVAEQLELLAAAFVDGPTGLSTLQICRLLLRCGYSPTARDAKIVKRLDRIERDLSHDGTIDRQCSLCTATGVSCLVLSGRKIPADRPLQWLRRLGNHAYSFRGRRTPHAKSHEHSMFYAANVLQAFIDSGATPRTVRSVLAHFFAPPRAKMVARWTKWRNESSFEVLGHIFSAFLSLFLTGHKNLLTQTETAHVQFAFDELRKELKHEEEAAVAGSGVILYAIREHLASYALAHLLGDRDATRQMEAIMDWLHDSIAMKRKKGAPPSGLQLLDSQLDETVVILEGIVCYYETKFLIRERTRPKPATLHKSRRHSEDSSRRTSARSKK